MIECALAVPASGWRPWVEAAADLRILRRLECPGVLLGEADELARAGAFAGLDWAHAHDLLPPATARRLADTPLGSGASWRATAERLGAACARLGIRRASIDLGLDGLDAGAGFAGALARRAGVLEPFFEAEPSRELTICVRLRQPPSYFGSREWEAAGNLLYELRDRGLALCVDFHPAELEDGFDIDAFLRRCVRRIAVLRFCYYPHAGETVPATARNAWAEALRRHGFRGLVVFRPRVDDPDELPRLLAAADEWAGLYR